MKQLFNLFYSSYQTNAPLYQHDEFKYILRALQVARYFDPETVKEVLLEFVASLREALPEASPTETRNESFKDYILRQDILYFFGDKLTPNANWREIDEKVLKPVRYGRVKNEVLGVNLNRVDLVLPRTVYEMLNAWQVLGYL